MIIIKGVRILKVKKGAGGLGILTFFSRLFHIVVSSLIIAND